jgi:hypothetical protein
VPDPIDSSSGHRFDALIDTIQRAVETQDYVLDRFYYPWPKSKKQRKTSPAARSTRGAGQEKQVEVMPANSPVKLTIKVKDVEDRPHRPVHQRQPGLLLFRAPPPDEDQPGGDSCPRLLQIFLVGETATAGIHKEALAASLEFIATLQEYKSTRTVQILGPYFSGSQASLKKGLQGWVKRTEAKRPPYFRVVSGSATQIDQESLEESCPSAKVTFKATVHPEENVIKKLLEYTDLATAGSGGRSI